MLIGMNYPHIYDEEIDTRIINWKQDGWDLQRELNHRQGLVVEVAGPTVSGYVWLNDTQLPGDLLVTNLRPNRTLVDIDLERDHIVHSDPVDVRAMPWADESVGVLLCSYLNLTESSAYTSVIMEGGSLTEEKRREWTNKTERARMLHDTVAVGIHTLEEVHPDALRLSFIREAKRVVEPGGIVMVNGVSSQELIILQQAGFTLRMATSDYGPNAEGVFSHHDRILYEAVLSRNL